MTGRNITKLVRAAQQSLRSSNLARASVRTPIPARIAVPVLRARAVSTTSRLSKGLSPESENPPPPNTAATSQGPVVPAPINENEYHELADEYLETILSKFEQLQDEREGVDVEMAAGVLTVSFPNIGTYVINKQPPNKQIWLSSPKSGPKRYDWVIIGDGQDQKEGTGCGDWVYVRDGSTLNDLFLAEIGIDLSMPIPEYGE